MKSQLKEIHNALVEQTDSLQSVIDQLHPEPVINLKASFINEHTIRVEWQSVQSGDMDIQYYSPSAHTKWQHSVQMYGHDVRLEDGVFDIGVGDFPDWKIRIVADEFTSDVVKVRKKQPEPQPQPSTELPRSPSLDPADWDVVGKIIDHDDFSGYDYNRPSIHLIGDTYYMICQGKRRGQPSTTGFVFTSKNLTDWKETVNNPVITNQQEWQGGVRAGAATAFKTEDGWACLFRDRKTDSGAYRGFRAAGLAVSTDFRTWQVTDKPYMTIEDAYDIIPKKYFLENPIHARARVYPRIAFWKGEWLYLVITCSINRDGRSQDFILRTNHWQSGSSYEFVRDAHLGELPTGGQPCTDGVFWLRGISEDGTRGAGMDIKPISEPFEPKKVFDYGFPQNPSMHFPYYDEKSGKWYVFYDDRNGNLYAAREL